MPITSDRYVGSSTAGPTDLTYFGVRVASSFGSTMSDGVVYKLRLTQRIEFFDRKNLDDVGSFSLRKAPTEQDKIKVEQRVQQMRAAALRYQQSSSSEHT